MEEIKSWASYFKEGGNLSKFLLILSTIPCFFLVLASVTNFENEKVIIFFSLCYLLLGPIIITRIRYIGGIKIRPESKLSKVLEITFEILICILISAFYLVLMTKNYNLYYSYWIIAFSFAGISLNTEINRYIQKKSENNSKESFIKLSTIASIFLLLSCIGILLNGFNSEKKIITTTELKKPNEINLTLEYTNRTKSRDFKVLLGEWDKNTVTIKDSKLINDLYNEIENKTLENISGIESLNYMRMFSDQENYVAIIGQFSNGNIASKDMNVSNGYIDIMRLYPNGKLVIIEYSGEHDEYPLQVSQDITNHIFEAANNKSGLHNSSLKEDKKITKIEFKKYLL